MTYYCRYIGVRLVIYWNVISVWQQVCQVNLLFIILFWPDFIRFLLRCIAVRDEEAVRLRPSVCQMPGLWQNRTFCPDFLYHLKDHLFQFPDKENGWWNFGSNWHVGPIFARSASAITLSEKVQLTLIGSPLRAFQWAYDKRRTLPLSLQMGLKNAKSRCPV